MRSAPSSRPPGPGLLQINFGLADSSETRNVLESLSTRALLDELPDSVLVMDVAGVVQYLNLSAVRLLGLSRARARGRSANGLLTLVDHDTCQPIPEPLAYLLACADTGSTGRYELLARHDGSTIPVDYTISPLRDSHRAITGLVLFLRDASLTYARIEQLVDAASHDENTHLLRRGELERRLARVLQTMTDGDCHALLFMDLDRFKAINDQAGHHAGDIALREVAELFRAQVRERDTLARLGGDEFGLLLEHCPLELARERAQALQAALAGHAVATANRKFAIGVSIGIAAIRGGGRDVQAVIAAADAACYAAKRQTGTAVRIAETILE